MKIRVRRAKKDLSTTSIAILAIGIIFATVIIVGWFREGGLAVFDNPGSAADWFAAVGTWMIGFGATKFAANNYQLQLHERREKLLQDAESRLAATKAKLASVTNWSSDIRIYAGVFQQHPLNAMDSDLIQDVLKRTAKVLQEAPWDNHDMIDLMADDVVQLGQTLHRANSCAAIIQAILNNKSKRSEKIDPASALEVLVQELSKVSAGINPLRAHLDQKVYELQRKRDHVSSRLEREAEKLLND